MCVRSANAQLVFLRTQLEPRHVALHNQGVDAAVSFFRVGLGDHEVRGCAVAVGDPILGAVQEVVVAHVHGGCALRSGVGSRFRFGEAKRPDFFPRGEGHEVLLFLGFGAEFLQAVTNQRVVDAHADAGGRVDFADFFHGQHVAHRVHARPSVFGVHHHAHEAQLAQLADFVGGEPLFVVAFNDAGLEDVLCKVSCGVTHCKLFFGEVEVHCLWSWKRCSVNKGRSVLFGPCLAKIHGGALPMVGSVLG